MNYKSQCGEDRYIFETFLADKERKNAAAPLIEIGANDGMTLSNTYAIADHFKSKRILVDASPLAKSWFGRRQLPDDTYISAAVVPNDFKGEKITLFESGSHCGELPEINRALVSTIIPEETKRWKNREHFTKVEVPVIRVSDLQKRIYEALEGVQPLLMSIDIEGMDYQILSDWDFSLIKPEFLIVEKQPNDNMKIVDKLFRHGFELINNNDLNMIFRDMKDKIERIDR